MRPLLERSRSSRAVRAPKTSGRAESWLWSRRRVCRLDSVQSSGTREASLLWLQNRHSEGEEVRQGRGRIQMNKSTVGLKKGTIEMVR